MSLALEPIGLPVDSRPSNLERWLKHYHLIAYMAHPYGLDPKNILAARTMAVNIDAHFPNLVLVNPLDNFLYTSWHTEDWIRRACLRVLRKCDLLLLTGDWRHSQGCWDELYQASEGLGIPTLVIDGNYMPHVIHVAGRG